MKKLIILQSTLAVLVVATPAFAATDGVSQIETFIQNLIQVFVTLAGLVAAGFFVVGGFHYITSSGNPLKLEKAKTTILYSAVGLVVVLAAFVLSNMVQSLGTTAFGAG